MPVLREDVECFGDDTCYSLAFGVPAIFMLVATLIIIMGKPLYKMVPQQGNILVRVFGAIGRALKKKVDGEHAEHWMDLFGGLSLTRPVADGLFWPHE